MASRRHPRETSPLFNEARAHSQATGHGSKRFSNDLSRDLAAMARVWKLLRQGAVRWLGEVGRQY
ncbi:MAG: hypothetical protein AB8E74_01030 [Prochlorococcus sp.]|nr:hypothetical protein [Prochlorococcaceae cyanobacterium Fu_MAG_50]